MNWETLEKSSTSAIIAWAESQQWCTAMAACQQDKTWHAEGDVWTHTKMVLQCLAELDEWESLSPKEHSILIFTALFHDVAKPLTTVLDDDGHVRSPKHAVKGEQLARSILRELNCDLDTREQICRMVRFHGRPAFLTEKEQPEIEVAKLSWLVNNKLLFLFAVADTRGRTTQSMTRSEENLQYWKLLSQEVNCFERPFPFSSDHSRFEFFRSSNPNLHYTPHDDCTFTATILSGLPGSGKDTWISKNKESLPCVSLDNIRQRLDISPTDNQGLVAQNAREELRHLLRTKKSLVFNATNTTRLIRRNWIDLCAQYGANIEIIYVEPPLEKIFQQNSKRARSVPASVIQRLAEKCEPPTWAECHQLALVSA